MFKKACEYYSCGEQKSIKTHYYGIKKRDLCHNFEKNPLSRGELFDLLRISPECLNQDFSLTFSAPPPLSHNIQKMLKCRLMAKDFEIIPLL